MVASCSQVVMVTSGGFFTAIGRAGRDGLNAQCLLLFSYGDIHKLKYFINQKQGDELKAALQNLKAMTWC